MIPEQYATNHSVILYGDPSPELIQTAKTRGVDVRDLIKCHVVVYTITLVVSHEIHLKERPIGMPTNENFEIEVHIPEPSDGEFLVRNIWMSLSCEYLCSF